MRDKPLASPQGEEHGVEEGSVGEAGAEVSQGLPFPALVQGQHFGVFLVDQEGGPFLGPYAYPTAVSPS